MDTSTSDLREPLSLSDYHVSEDLGFILEEPLATLPPYYSPWMELAPRVPELLQAHTLRPLVLQMPLLDTQQLQSHRELRLAHLALSVVAMGYVWQEGERDTVKALPACLAVPYWEVSQRIGLPPILTHADAVLANWRRTDPEGPFDMGNLELLFTLPGGQSMHGFFLVSLLVEFAAAAGLKVIPQVFKGVCQSDVAMVTQALDAVSQALYGMREILKLMHVHVDPAVFYGVMRIYLSGWKDNPSMAEGLVYEGVRSEPMEYSGGSAAQSSLLHCFDELLGISHSGDSGGFLSRMRSYMPPAHKDFILAISQQPPLQAFVEARAEPVLTAAFRRCVDQLAALRSYHITVVTRYVVVPAARARQLHQNQETTTERDTVAMAPASLQDRGTGGSRLLTFLKEIRDQTRDTSVCPCLNGEGLPNDA